MVVPEWLITVTGLVLIGAIVFLVLWLRRPRRLLNSAVL